MSARVIAIDASLTASGVVWGSSDTPHMKVLAPSTKGTLRLRQIRDMVGEILETGHRDETLVLLEGYAFARANQAHQIGELGGVLRVMFDEWEMSWLEVAPSSVKKFATGKGTGSKDLVLSAVTHRTGQIFESNDLTDAMAIFCIGRSLLGLQHPMGDLPQTHMAALEVLHLPLLWRERHPGR